MNTNGIALPKNVISMTDALSKCPESSEWFKGEVESACRAAPMLRDYLRAKAEAEEVSFDVPLEWLVNSLLGGHLICNVRVDLKNLHMDDFLQPRKGFMRNFRARRARMARAALRNTNDAPGDSGITASSTAGPFNGHDRGASPVDPERGPS